MVTYVSHHHLAASEIITLQSLDIEPRARCDMFVPCCMLLKVSTINITGLTVGAAPESMPTEIRSAAKLISFEQNVLALLVQVVNRAPPRPVTFPDPADSHSAASGQFAQNALVRQPYVPLWLLSPRMYGISRASYVRE